MNKRAFGIFTATSAVAVSAFGQPFGGFEPQRSFPVGTGPREVVVADFNGDGRLDLATPNATANTVSVLLGNGDGTFGAAVHYAVQQTPLTIEAADLDGDGDTDITVANGNTPSISVLHGNGDGTFVTHQTIVFDIDAPPFPGVFMAHTMADLDGDSDVDIAVQSLTANVLMLLPNDGTGTFGPFQVIVEDTTFAFPTDLEPADVDGDHDVDLIETVGSNVRVYLNNGDGTFAPVLQFPMQGHDIMTPLADLNGDGFIDIATNNTVNPGGFISIALGNGDGTFGAVTTYPVNRPSGITSCDLDGDGFVDLAVTSYSAFNSVSVMFGDDSGTFASPVPFAVGSNNPEGVLAADFNGDSWPDLVTSNRGGNNVSIFLNLTRSPCPADYNGDGGIDGADVEAFFIDWESGEARADVNRDGGVDGADVEAFFAAWEAGGCE